MFRVKFIELRKQSIETNDYENLFDAIKVAKETNVGSESIIREAIPDVVFNEQFNMLLTSGFIYSGWRTSEYPEGDVMIMLLKVDKHGTESPVYNNLFYAMPPVAKLPIVPSQEHKTEPAAGNYN